MARAAAVAAASPPASGPCGSEAASSWFGRTDASSPAGPSTTSSSPPPSLRTKRARNDARAVSRRSRRRSAPVRRRATSSVSIQSAFTSTGLPRRGVTGSSVDPGVHPGQCQALRALAQQPVSVDPDPEARTLEMVRHDLLERRGELGAEVVVPRHVDVAAERVHEPERPVAGVVLERARVGGVREHALGERRRRTLQRARAPPRRDRSRGTAPRTRSSRRVTTHRTTGTRRPPWGRRARPRTGRRRGRAGRSRLPRPPRRRARRRADERRRRSRRRRAARASNGAAAAVTSCTSPAASSTANAPAAHMSSIGRSGPGPPPRVPGHRDTRSRRGASPLRRPGRRPRT